MRGGQQVEMKLLVRFLVMWQNEWKYKELESSSQLAWMEYLGESLRIGLRRFLVEIYRKRNFTVSSISFLPVVDRNRTSVSNPSSVVYKQRIFFRNKCLNVREEQYFDAYSTEMDYSHGSKFQEIYVVLKFFPFGGTLMSQSILMRIQMFTSSYKQDRK